MAFTKCVTARDECYGFIGIHCHAAERIFDIKGRLQRIWLCVRAFRVDVDQSHLHSRQRCGEFTITCVTLVCQPFSFWAPVDVFFRLVDIGTSAAKAERFKPARLHRNVAGEDHQVSPGNLVSVLLLNRPKQAAGFVQIAIIWPAVEGSETLRP